MNSTCVPGQEAYRQALGTDPDAALWLQPWWLDATCGDTGWSAITVHEDGVTRGAMAFRSQTRRGVPRLGQAPLSLGGGPWLQRHDEMGLAKWQAFETKVLRQLAEALPRSAYYQQNWVPKRNNWLPFYWSGFTQTTRYTYQLDLTRKVDDLWSGMSATGRRTIRKSKDRFNVGIQTTDDFDSLIRLNNEVYGRQGLNPPHSVELMSRVFDRANERDACELLEATDDAGNLHAMLFVVRDKNTTYSLISGSDERLRSSGALHQTFWEAIQRSSGRSQRWDFAGSMVEPIEQFLRSFGPTRVPYFNVYGSKSRTTRRLLRLGLI